MLPCHLDTKFRKWLYPERSNQTDAQCTNVQLSTALWKNRLDYRSITTDQLPRHLNRSKTFNKYRTKVQWQIYILVKSSTSTRKFWNTQASRKLLPLPAPLLVKTINLVIWRSRVRTKAKLLRHSQIPNCNRAKVKLLTCCSSIKFEIMGAFSQTSVCPLLHSDWMFGMITEASGTTQTIFINKLCSE